ncbi:MAG: radical SAM protein [Vicinamibacterales bacterium]
MHKVPLSLSARVVARAAVNWMAGRPIVISFEVTDACTCWCRHCDHGGPRDVSRDLKPREFARYVEALAPCVVQVSGGEPLLRADLLDIVRNIKAQTTLPYTILVSNWSLMTMERYTALREAGVDQFSVSLDFPDERHDDFRRHPGLFAHLERTVPPIAALGHDDVVLNACITSANVGEINNIADKAHEWGVNVSYSAYAPRRTGNQSYFLNTKEQLDTLREEFDRLKERMKENGWIANSRTTIDRTRKYFEDGRMPRCKAGMRFLVVTSDGWLQPCSMQVKRFPLEDRARMVETFTATNTCDQCYVSIRAYLDKSLGRLFLENLQHAVPHRGHGRHLVDRVSRIGRDGRDPESDHHSL